MLRTKRATLRVSAAMPHRTLVVVWLPSVGPRELCGQAAGRPTMAAVIRLCLQVLDEHRLPAPHGQIHPLRVMSLPGAGGMVAPTMHSGRPIRC
jgi:hypothetical protein